ncbi:hypothetical protein V6N11_052711 [Hibiscus sabdariffa]|uniref:Uncharacterized protein n=1 Tax=Hibiscus sabdariffa TaxID=183260 RepID=A0ABR2UBC3_9ROSI
MVKLGRMENGMAKPKPTTTHNPLITYSNHPARCIANCTKLSTHPLEPHSLETNLWSTIHKPPFISTLNLSLHTPNYRAPNHHKQQLLKLNTYDPFAHLHHKIKALSYLSIITIPNIKPSHTCTHCMPQFIAARSSP